MRAWDAVVVDYARQMDVNVGKTGTAHGVTFDVKGYPVMKTPYAIFPADSDRQSGFLSGREGYSGLRGVQWLQPYYIAINKSSDATVAFDVETSQRIGGLVDVVARFFDYQFRLIRQCAVGFRVCWINMKTAMGGCRAFGTRI
jgi:lipopolysaccharide assembly outer membrane protein LptD (OstA)